MHPTHIILCSNQKHFTARRYVSAADAVLVRPSVCPSVCLSHAGIVSKRQNVGSRKQRLTTAEGLHFSGNKDIG